MTDPTTEDLAQEIARREALGAAWSASAKPLRERLHTEATQEYVAKRRRVTWDIDGVGRLALPLTKAEPYIADINALLGWVRKHYPEQVQTVEQVYAAFQRYLIENVVVVDGVPVDPSSGETVEGMAVRVGGQPKTLSITFDATVKRQFAAYAEQEVARQLAAEYGTQDGA